MAKILVADDEKPVRDYFNKLLSRLGHTVVLASDGDEACEKISDPTVQLAVTDFFMPGRARELELIRELRRLRPELPIVVISGQSPVETLGQCEELGVRDFLTKPFELSFVSTVIRKLLGEAAEGDS